MALTIYHESDANLALLTDVPIAVLGYGNQGRTHALNLRDSGLKISVGQRPGPSADRARQDGFEPIPIDQAASECDLLIMTLPDESAAQIYEDEIAAHLRPAQILGFVHGFNIRYQFINPPKDIDVIMIAPKGPGTLLRSLYEQGKGLPALLAVEQDFSGRAKNMALSWAAGIGCTRAGVVHTTFASETETDLFGEQVVLCGGMSALTKAAFETLVEAGYEPEFAYLECVHELKQVADLLYERGLAGMRDRISNTATYGDLTRGPRIVDQQVKARMRQILREVQDGSFAREWIEEYRLGGKKFKALFDADVDTPYERAGQAVRDLMPWLKSKE